MEELQVKRVQEHENQERHIRDKIEVKMERIKAAQQKNKGHMLREPKSHHAGNTTWISGYITALKAFYSEIRLWK